MLGKKTRTDSIRTRLVENLEQAKEGLAAVNQREGELHTHENEILQKLRRTSIEAKSANLADLETPISSVDLADVEIRRLEEHLTAIRHALIDLRETRKPHLEAFAGAQNALYEHDRTEGRRELDNILPKIVDAIEAAFPAYKRANAGRHPSRRGLVVDLFAAWEARQEAIPCFGGPTRKFDEGGGDA